MRADRRDGPEIWAGVECTINRVGDRYKDQCALSGHSDRPEDLDLFASLGVKRIRYPCLWERIQPAEDRDFDWSWADERLPRLRELGIEPIAGLLHHGSGPRFTGLLDPEFPAKFARFARAFAERYPWVRFYTPINEPLTTARFSCLYGVWYPHLKDDRGFVRALYHQVRATSLAMSEIRRVRPDAELIQTEDLGRASSTAPLAYQCKFENERRWLTTDLLCGRVDGRHPLVDYLRRFGLSEAELSPLVESPCPPDLIGINHYLLSNRFLDHRLDLYPSGFHGGNGIEAYADVGAVDSGQVTPPTPESIFEETWRRYERPIAVTEVHVAGHREAQIRWLGEIWSAARRLRADGVDFRAVTAWSLLGTYDWNTLCTREDRFYESGVFDVRAERPRETLVTKMVRGIARDGEFRHPVLAQPGWWKTPRRVLFAPSETEISSYVNPVPGARPILITGAGGTLGRALIRACERRGLFFRATGRSDLDIADPESIRRFFGEQRPWAVVNAAGDPRVDEAEHDPERCFRENAQGAVLLARACAERNLPFLTFSSDLVFDGRKGSPYVESDAVSPLNAYGRAKVEAERGVLRENPASLIVRTSWFFGPWDERNFLTRMLGTLLEGRPFEVPSGLRVSPSYVPDVANLALDLLLDCEEGIMHLAHPAEIEASEWARMAIRLARRFEIHLDEGHLIEREPKELGWKAARPRASALASRRADLMPALEDALERYFLQLEIADLARARVLTGEQTCV